MSLEDFHLLNNEIIDNSNLKRLFEFLSSTMRKFEQSRS